MKNFAIKRKIYVLKMTNIEIEKNIHKTIVVINGLSERMISSGNSPMFFE